MQFVIDEKSTVPIYQQFIDQITQDIVQGALPPGYKLPTVRQLAAENGIAHGTIKHAYDLLEHAGLIKKTRGSGTYVAEAKEAPRGSKVQAMQSIDAMLDRLVQLSFSLKDIRIFLDLKLREREEQSRNITVAAVDCSPEALSVMYNQIAELHVDVYKFLLQEVLNAPDRFEPATDIVVTTPTHYEKLLEKMPPGKEPLRLVMAIATDTVLDLAALPPETRLGIICASRRFAQVILRACEGYCNFEYPIRVAYFSDEQDVIKLIEECNRLILPPGYSLFITGNEEALLRACKTSHNPIQYRYQIERGSLLHLEEQISRIHKP
jgi:DNA-binding transcriptional regulator YhcF (GntR family)